MKKANHLNLSALSGFYFMWYRYAIRYISQYLESLKWVRSSLLWTRYNHHGCNVIFPNLTMDTSNIWLLVYGFSTQYHNILLCLGWFPTVPTAKIYGIQGSCHVVAWSCFPRSTGLICTWSEVISALHPLGQTIDWSVVVKNPTEFQSNPFPMILGLVSKESTKADLYFPSNYNYMM